MAASELKIYVSNINLNKSKKKLFLYIEILLKRYDFLYIVTGMLHLYVNENLKKIDKKKYCFKRI